MLSLSRGNEVFSLYKVWKFKITCRSFLLHCDLCSVLGIHSVCVCFQKNRASSPLKSKKSLHLFCHIWTKCLATFSSHSDIWWRFGCVFFCFYILGWKLICENSAPRACVRKEREIQTQYKHNIKHNTDICTKSWVPVGYQDFGLGCKPYWECSFLIPGEHPDTRRQKLLTLYSTDHFHSLILVLTRLQPFLWKK